MLDSRIIPSFCNYCIICFWIYHCISIESETRLMLNLIFQRKIWYFFLICVNNCLVEQRDWLEIGLDWPYNHTKFSFIIPKSSPIPVYLFNTLYNHLLTIHFFLQTASDDQLYLPPTPTTLWQFFYNLAVLTTTVRTSDTSHSQVDSSTGMSYLQNQIQHKKYVTIVKSLSARCLNYV